ncbi:YSH1 Predicted exonuclease of the beta-lactamase fold involved in RNA processing [Candidatus Nanopelagicaceae bacterium]
MSDVTITFLGATETVTGSRFLISTPLSKILVDCGLYQGVKSIARKNWETFPIDPRQIDGVVLTHAHLDHCGYLPLLVKQGFSKEIYGTRYTLDIAKIIMRDSAHLQMEDAKYAAKKGYSSHKDPQPLYNLLDAEKAIDHLRERPFREKVKIADDIFVTFYPSGHILGSSFVLIEAAGKNFLFSGDLGRDNHPLLSVPDAPPAVDLDVVVTESTYGDRIHDTTPEDFARELNDAIARGGSILIPAFAVDRTEVILMALKELIHEKKIPALPIYVDSPMALSALNFYREAITTNSPEIRAGVSARFSNEDPFDAGALHQMVTTEDSKSINDITETSIIISASGMATGGRVVHHLANMLPNPKNTVILVGYQAVGSRGRSLEDGEQVIKIHGKPVTVAAHISKVESFSVHADSDELIQWLGKAHAPKQAFIVHGESEGQERMRERLTSELGWNAIIPEGMRSYPV